MFPPPGGYPQPGGYPGIIPIHGLPQPQGNSDGYDPEDPEVKGFDFTDESIRKGFIRKVYMILCVSCDFFFYLYILYNIRIIFTKTKIRP